MGWLDRLRFKGKMAVLVGLLLGGFLLFGVATYETVGRVKVGGPVYGQVVEMKDLLADILPPPEYIIESYLNVLQLASVQDARERETLIATGQRLEKDFTTRHEYWLKTLQEGQIKDLILKTAYGPATAFYKVRDEEFRPALRSGDRDKAQSALAVMARHYQDHRAAIDQLVERSTTRSQEIETAAAATVRQRALFLTVLLFALVICCAATAWFIARSALRSVGTTVQALGSATQGLTAASQSMSATSVETSSQAATVTEASTKVSENLQTLAASADQMAAAIKEVARSAVGAAERTRSSVDVATNIEKATGRLAQSSAEAEQAVAAVAKIAQQTNTLSQAASVEATRATEAGKGFEAVASEVKALAHATAQAASEINELLQLSNKDDQSQGQTARTDVDVRIRQATVAIDAVARQTNLLALNAIIEARRAMGAAEAFASVATQVKELATTAVTVTEDVNRKLAAIQDGTRTATTGVGQIRVLVEELDGLTTQIAGAVEEQSATTNLMADQVKNAAGHAYAIVESVRGVAIAAEETAKSSHDTLSAADDLVEVATRLAREFDTPLATTAAAPSPTGTRSGAGPSAPQSAGTPLATSVSEGEDETQRAA